MKKSIMTVSAVVFAMSSCLCCNAAEVDSTIERVEQIEDALYDTASDFMRARLGVRAVKKYEMESADRPVSKMVYKYTELSTMYELCDVAGVEYYEHENVREYGRLLMAYILMDVESARDMGSVNISKMVGILKEPTAERAAVRAGYKMFIESSSIQEGIQVIRDELVAKYGENGLKKRMDDIIHFQRAIADFVLKD